MRHILCTIRTHQRHSLHRGVHVHVCILQQYVMAIQGKYMELIEKCVVYHVYFSPIDSLHATTTGEPLVKC